MKSYLNFCFNAMNVFYTKQICSLLLHGGLYRTSCFISLSSEVKTSKSKNIRCTGTILKEVSAEEREFAQMCIFRILHPQNAQIRFDLMNPFKGIMDLISHDLVFKFSTKKN